MAADVAPAVVAVTVAAVSFLVIAERHDAPVARAASKVAASTGFVALALVLGAPSTPYGRVILVALVLSWLGDVLLIPRGKGPAFLAGLASFLLAHVAFAVAFLVRGASWPWTLGAAAVAGGAALLVLARLRPHLSARMRLPVRAYVAASAAMVALAVGAGGAGAPPVVPVAAVAFAASDLLVARQRFVEQAFVNKLVGLPLYYAAQVALASSVAL